MPSPHSQQPVVQVGVVAGAEERFRVGAGEFGVQVGDDRYLVLTSGDGEDAADPGVREGIVDVSRPGLRCRTHLSSGRVLHRHQASDLGEPSHGLLVHVRIGARCCERRRNDRDVVSRVSLARVNKFPLHVKIHQERAYWLEPSGCRTQFYRRIVTQDCDVQPLQRRGRVDAELVA